MIILWSWCVNICNKWRKFQGLHFKFPDIILRSWGLHEIPKFQGLREIPGLHSFPVTHKH